MQNNNNKWLKIKIKIKIMAKLSNNNLIIINDNNSKLLELFNYMYIFRNYINYYIIIKLHRF